MECRIEVPSELFVEGTDLCIILGNLLDNALEAVGNLPVERRLVKLVVSLKKGTLHIMMENPYAGEIMENADGTIKSSKGKGDLHGYGLVRMFEIGAAVLTSLAIGMCVGMLKQTLLFFLFFIPLRSYLGGFHLRKYRDCYLMSCLTLAAVLAITRFASFDMHVSCALILSIACPRVGAVCSSVIHHY